MPKPLAIKPVSRNASKFDFRIIIKISAQTKIFSQNFNKIRNNLIYVRTVRILR
jgi:hypothetical protein